MSTASTGLMGALLAFQAEAPTLQKNATAKVTSKKTGQSFTYAYLSLDALMDAVLPELSKCGLVWMTFPAVLDGKAALTYRLVHASSGEEVGGSMPLMCETQDPQVLGSAITYARRYSMMAVLGLAANEDDDAKRAAKRARRTQSTTSRLLTDQERSKVVRAITEAGYDEDGLQTILGAVGAETVEDLTTAQAFEIRKLLDKDK
jgi:ERF superfamily